jgi:hypothetical protein
MEEKLGEAKKQRQTWPLVCFWHRIYSKRTSVKHGRELVGSLSSDKCFSATEEHKMDKRVGCILNAQDERMSG